MLHEEPTKKREQISLVCIDELVPQNHLLRKIDRTVAFTLDVYGHTTDSMRKDAADRMCTYIQSVTGDEK